MTSQASAASVGSTTGGTQSAKEIRNSFSSTFGGQTQNIGTMAQYLNDLQMRFGGHCHIKKNWYLLKSVPVL